MDKYQYGIKRGDGMIMTIPTLDQGLPHSVVNEELLREKYDSDYTLVRREVGKWEEING